MADRRDADLKARLRAALVRHLQRHPLAGDTVDGMVACWLPRHGLDDALQFVGEVVESMVAAGELLPTRLPDGRLFYQRGPALASRD